MSARRKVTDAQRDEARAELRKLLPPGSTVWTVLRHRSASGMSRLIDAYLIVDNQPRWLSRLVSRATGRTFDEKREALRVKGCGLDTGAWLVSSLAHDLYPDGFGCLGEGCPASDHSNGDRDFTPHSTGDIRWTEGSKYKGPHHHWHTSGDHALRARWL